MLCVQRAPTSISPRGTGKVDISLLLKQEDEEISSPQASSRSTSVPAANMHHQTGHSVTPTHQQHPQQLQQHTQQIPQHYMHSPVPAHHQHPQYKQEQHQQFKQEQHPQFKQEQPPARPLTGTPTASAQSLPSKRPLAANPTESPAKKQSKWSPEEDTIIVDLRGKGMKWEDISKQLPGRSAISCRLHYQNYLERRCEWDEDRKNKLARLYERFKQEMWAKVAEEMAIPWRAAEAMHWTIGEHEMARRAGVAPFMLANASNETTPKLRRSSSTSAPRSRRDSLSRPGPQQVLPSLAELTAGIPAYAGPHPGQPPSIPQSHALGGPLPMAPINTNVGEPYPPRSSPQSLHQPHSQAYGGGPPGPPGPPGAPPGYMPSPPGPPRR